MKLIPCPACAIQISSDAASCPRCGQPIRAGKNRDAFAGKIIIVVLFVVGAIVLLGWKIYQINSDARQADAIERMSR